jgi:hypothetical protein
MLLIEKHSVPPGGRKKRKEITAFNTCRLEFGNWSAATCPKQERLLS